MVLHQAVQTELSGLLPAQHESLQVQPVRPGQYLNQALPVERWGMLLEHLAAAV
jgi:hypothetical protein